MEKKLWACFGTVPVILTLANWAEGWGHESSSSSCLSQLAHCLKYLNVTGDVPDSCCDPLKYGIKSKLECLCNVISNKGSREAERAGIIVTEAQQLPGRCGQHVNPLVCLSISGSSNSKTSAEDSAGFLLFHHIASSCSLPQTY